MVDNILQNSSGLIIFEDHSQSIIDNGSLEHDAIEASRIYAEDNAHQTQESAEQTHGATQQAHESTQQTQEVTQQTQEATQQIQSSAHCNNVP